MNCPFLFYFDVFLFYFDVLVTWLLDYQYHLCNLYGLLFQSISVFLLIFFFPDTSIIQTVFYHLANSYFTVYQVHLQARDFPLPWRWRLIQITVIIGQ